MFSIAVYAFAYSLGRVDNSTILLTIRFLKLANCQRALVNRSCSNVKNAPYHLASMHWKAALAKNMSNFIDMIACAHCY